MASFMEYLSGCGDLAVKPLTPNNADKLVSMDYMPMVIPFVHPSSVFTGPILDYYGESADYYRKIRDAMDLQINSLASFTEYRFTIETSQLGVNNFPYYAMTNGYLYYVRSGQSYPNLLGNVVPNQDMLVLVPLDSSITALNLYRPELSALLKKMAYLKSDLESVSLTSNLKGLIRQFLSETFFLAQYRQVLGQDYSGPKPADYWVDQYYDLFFNHPEVPILVQGGSELAIGIPDTSVPEAPQRLGLFFEFKDWSNDDQEWREVGWAGNEASVKTFFFYRNRMFGLEGHPMISLLTGLPVEAGYVDFISPDPLYEPWEGRKKSWLRQLTDAPYYPTQPPHHAIAIEAGEHPAYIVIQEPRQSGTPPANFPTDHGITKILLQNPFPLILTLSIDFADPSQATDVTITRSTYSSTQELISFTPNRMGIGEVKLKINATHTDFQEPFELMEIILLPRRFGVLQVWFHQLIDSTHQANTTDQQLRTMIDIVNYYLLRQANVFIEPVKINGTILHPLDEYKDDSLGDGDKIDTENTTDSIADFIYQNSATYGKHNVVFTWKFYKPDETDRRRDPLGVTATKLLLKNAIYSISLVDVTYRSTASLPGQMIVSGTMMHEMGHMISLLHLGNDSCSDGKEHFNHSCPGSDQQWYNNMMQSGTEKGGEISRRQADVLNAYVTNLPQP